MRTILPACCVLAFYLASCSSEAHNGSAGSFESAEIKDKMTIESGHLVGTWVQEDTGDNIINPLQGYQFKADGSLEPINISTLDTSKWFVTKDELSLCLKSVESKHPDTVKYKVAINKDVLILTSVNNSTVKETYLRIR